MSRSERLLQLMQILRRHHYPVRGANLAQELGISLRSLYRDIASLQAQGAQITGEAGIGYVLQAGFTLPPLMFNTEEIEALVLGSRWVAKSTDAQLAHAAKDALAKIAAVLPGEARHELETSGLMIGPDSNRQDENHLREIRVAIRKQCKLEISYCDEHGNISQRTVWPCALAFFDRVRVLVAWCELREDFRHFRTDRINDLRIGAQGFPRSRASLLKAWKAQQGILPE
jgi:predicted DNA-binding transcriptional regulator YafY